MRWCHPATLGPAAPWNGVEKGDWCLGVLSYVAIYALCLVEAFFTLVWILFWSRCYEIRRFLTFLSNSVNSVFCSVIDFCIPFLFTMSSWAKFSSACLSKLANIRGWVQKHTTHLFKGALFTIVKIVTVLYIGVHV